MDDVGPVLAQVYIFCGVVGVTSFHVFHLHWLNRYVHAAGQIRHLKPGGGLASASASIGYVVLAIAILTTLHVVNCLIWGLMVWMAGAFDRMEDAVFYAFEDYTALGLTRVEIPWRWRYFAPAISFTGVLCFAWAGAILAAMFVRLYGASSDDHAGGADGD